MGGFGKNVNKINLKTAGDDNYDDDDDDNDENSHDLLPLMNLTTASDDFYPTVVLNAAPCEYCETSPCPVIDTWSFDPSCSSSITLWA